MSKVIIVPIVAVLALVVKAITGIEIDADTQTAVVEFIGYISLGVVGVIGVVKNFKNKLKKEKDATS